MQCFGEYRNQTIHSLIRMPKTDETKSLIKNPHIATVEKPSTKELLSFAADDGIPISESDLNDQFIVFQFKQAPDGPTIMDMTEVNPVLAGSETSPDAIAKIQLMSFNVGTGDAIEKDTRATLRLDFGKDSSSESPLSTVFWSVAAGLNLYNTAKKKSTEAKDLKADFNETFSWRPIEIPGGLGRLSFEVVKHREPKWWQQLFSFLQSSSGAALTSALGFPAITQQAVGFIDELLNRLDKSDPEILFKGRPMTLALTKKAKEDFIGGTLESGQVSNTNVGVINPGFCLLARGRDYNALLENEPVYMGAYGLLKPKNMKLADFLQSPGDNPFNTMTYAVLKIGSAEAKLNPSLINRLIIVFT